MPSLSCKTNKVILSMAYFFKVRDKGWFSKDFRSYFHHEMPPFTAFCEEKRKFYTFRMADCTVKVC